MPLHPVQRQSVADAVFEQLSGEVLTGELEPGDELPAERALTQALGVNRQAVREALQRLAEAGLVEIRHGGRTKVRDYRRAAGLELLPRLLVRGDGRVDAAVAEGILELRACLGPDIARRCAERGDDQTRRTVAGLTEQMRDAGDDLDALAALDLQLWDTLVDGSGNIAYRLAFNGLLRTYEPITGVLQETFAEELRDHPGRAVLSAAVVAGDGPAAAAAAQRLLGRGERAVRRLLHTIDAHAAEETGHDDD
jgi:GntR family transcriptional regulator, transcriptional repressor for pyruvate dehydrogenase complex